MKDKEKQSREYRGVRDEIRQQQMKAKDMTFKEKLGYFWYYYKVHTIVTILLVLGVSIFVHDMVTSKDTQFYGIMLNSVLLEGDSMEQAFGEYAELDLETYECFIDADSTLSYANSSQYDMATMQRLIALVQTGDLDAVVFDSEVYNNYANNEMFLDLRTVLTPEEIETYEDSFYYIDYAEVLAAEQDPDYVNAELVGKEDGSAYTPEEVDAEADIHRHPENMKDPMPVGIFMEDSPFAVKSMSYPGLIPVFGISATTTRPELARTYLQFLWDDSIDFEAMRMESVYG